MGFGKLRVLNDDTILGGGGFPIHHHDNMEIITVVLSGALAHQDSLGNGGIIKAGEIQVMSAGRGIDHSEYNHSATEPVSLFQIWIETKEKNVPPRYGQKHFTEKDFINQVKVVASGYDETDALYIHQLARVALLKTDQEKIIFYALAPNSGLYIMNISGQIKIADQILMSRDAAAISQTSAVEIKISKYGEALLIETLL